MTISKEKGPDVPPEAEAVVDFWKKAGPDRWFSKDAEFDRAFGERFLASHEAAARGEYPGWIDTPNGALALVLLLDQFPRNVFRGTPRMFATDALAREVAAKAIDTGYDARIDPALRVFFCLPFEHSEDIADQERALALAAPLGPELTRYAREHYGIIARFGRFPHRNAVLGRTMTAEEQLYLDSGGFAG